MDRGSQNNAGVLAAKPNGTSYGNIRGGKSATQPFGNRRPLKKDTSKPDSKENITSDTDTTTSISSLHPLYTGPKYIPKSNSFSASAQKLPDSPRETRIPRPTNAVPAPASPNHQNKPGHQTQTQSLDMRQPMSMRSAFALAQKQQKQEADDDEPDDTLSFKQAFDIATAEVDGRIDGSPSPAPRHIRRQSHGTAPQGPLTTRPNGDLGSRLQQFDRNHNLDSANGLPNGLFGKARVGPKVSETGHILAKKASDSSLRGSPARRRDSQWSASPVKRDSAVGVNRAIGPVDLKHSNKPTPIPSIEYESASDERASPNDQVVSLSPEKSQNWQLDADFTAGDIQISDSPRIRTIQSNGRIPRRSPSATNSPSGGTPYLRRSNNRLDQIRQKEIEAANAVLPEETSLLPRRNSRLEEVHLREMEATSKRAVSTSRLDEIRVKNSEARSESPEAARSSNKEDLQGSSLALEAEPTKTPDSKTGLETKEGHVSDTPVTIFRNTSDQKLSDASQGGDGPKVEDKKGNQLPRTDSHDLLRRLARATSASPPTEKTEKTEQLAISNNFSPKGGSESREDSRTRLTREEKRGSKNLDVKSSRERPTVGFAGLHSRASSDSLQDKRASQHGSEMDPTDRIEGELKLFAPLDNYSEKGSVRAPSPLPSEPEEDTPRPIRIDPLMQPTPRVTGAYVETPATVKIKQEVTSDEPMALNNLNQISSMPKFHSRSSSEPLDKGSATQQESKDAKHTRKSVASRSASAPTPSRRPRSALKRRRPLRPPINTAKPPSVKDDIRAILRENQIDDSTLDDFDSIIEDHQIDGAELEQMVNDTIHGIDDDFGPLGLSEQDRQLQVYDRMSKSLKTGLLGIQSAKKGIKRLEDKIIHTEQKANQAHTDLNGSIVKPEEHTVVKTGDADPIVLIPALYQRSPKFRLTKFGLLALIASIWYILESIFCFLYVYDYNCTPTVPCEWSPHEPYFPYAMPFMLDEWSTGGKGRKLTWKLGEEIGDMLADVSDWVTGTDFTQFDEMYMNVWERKRQMRRLQKHGLGRKWVPPPGYTPQNAAWNAARRAKEAAEEDGYEDEYESMGADEMLK
ncbi:hypothetical protein F4821DRAFT_242622 [Hypoxylon rubiginosum]|uniref:Uncharacterized protein n=1 Tax=Hypoxylon rubiginosum TaxID=110542 RepID=A0ACC0CWJ2_9PEZI|nr:hypothetical protein F4821DRAFT_242622 [Hypoxylon rubiginosum]